jgi:hypothetical protein
VFAKQLERHIEELGITHGTLICGESLKKPYVRVIEDVVKTIPLETEQQNRKELSPILIGIVSTLGVITKIVAVVVDWIVVWLATLGRSPMKNNIVYLPPH